MWDSKHVTIIIIIIHNMNGGAVVILKSIILDQLKCQRMGLDDRTCLPKRASHSHHYMRFDALACSANSLRIPTLKC